MQSASVAALGGVLLALSFPSAGQAWLAPFGAAALFLAWSNASWKRNVCLGWFAAWVWFTISFWWWSTTIVTVVGWLAYVAVILGAAYQALYVGIAGALATIAVRRASPSFAPLGVACAFCVMEWLRSIGVMGNPFAQLGYTQADTPLRPLAAYVGTIGISFALCLIGAYLADAIVRRVWQPLAIVCACVVIATSAAWIAWPARALAPPTIRVAAIQGNITQSLKWQPGALQTAVDRYTTMTRSAFASHPALVVWPETVIPISGGGLNDDPGLMKRFTDLARAGNTTIAVGSTEVRDKRWYNSLYFIAPTGLQALYEKRQLVPFAEHFPGQAFLGWLPDIGSLQGNFAEGNSNGVTRLANGLAIGSLICWESAFGDLAFDEVRNGANLLVISTDDAWFGTSSGPYQHAQIAQLRAIESGRYVVRAAATGISGIIAPDGTWQARSQLEQQVVVAGAIGQPVVTMFSRIGPNLVWLAIVCVYVASISGIGVRRYE